MRMWPDRDRSPRRKSNGRIMRESMDDVESGRWSILITARPTHESYLTFGQYEAPDPGRVMGLEFERRLDRRRRGELPPIDPDQVARATQRPRNAPPDPDWARRVEARLWTPRKEQARLRWERERQEWDRRMQEWRQAMEREWQRQREAR